MTASNQQIIEAFETLGLTPEGIAEEFDFDLTMVKAILMQYSSQFRMAARGNNELDFDDNEAKQIRDVILNTALYSEDEHLRFKAAKYIRDDKKGRLDLGTALKGLNINVVQINDRMQKAFEAVERSKKLSTMVDTHTEQKRLNSSPIVQVEATVVD